MVIIPLKLKKEQINLKIIIAVSLIFDWNSYWVLEDFKIIIFNWIKYTKSDKLWPWFQLEYFEKV